MSGVLIISTLLIYHNTTYYTQKKLKGGENMVNVDELMADIKRAELCHMEGNSIKAKLIINAVIKELIEIQEVMDEDIYYESYLGS